MSWTPKTEKNQTLALFAEPKLDEPKSPTLAEFLAIELDGARKREKQALAEVLDLRRQLRKSETETAHLKAAVRYEMWQVMELVGWLIAEEKGERVVDGGSTNMGERLEHVLECVHYVRHLVDRRCVLRPRRFCNWVHPAR